MDPITMQKVYEAIDKILRCYPENQENFMVRMVLGDLCDDLEDLEAEELNQMNEVYDGKKPV